MEPQDQQHDPFKAEIPKSGVDHQPVGPSPTPPTPPPAVIRERRGYGMWLGVAALVAAGVTAGTVRAANSPSESETAPLPAIVAAAAAPPTFEPVELPVEITPALLDASAVGAEVIPSVVTVQVGESDAEGNLLVRGSGSGIVYDAQGHIVTNSHVVAAGSTYEVVLADLRVYPAELIGTDPTTDLAVLSITALDIEPIVSGNSNALDVGAPAIAVGSPLGLRGGPSLTVGVISAFGREVRTSSTTTLYGMLQTDAPITQGSSGGALVDEHGRLVGITTAVGVSDVGIEGIGFATPIEVVTRVADEIIAGGGASNPYLGISGRTSFAETADGGTAPIGVFVNEVEPNTAASIAGLSEGDVIAAINGDTVKTMEELIALLRRYGAGSDISVTLDTGATVTVTLGQRPDA